MGYGIVVKSFGKIPDNSDKNKELLEKKKKLLQKQFEKQSKELTKNNKMIETNKEDLKNDNIKSNNKSNQELKLLKNQLKILKSEKKLALDKIKKLEKKITICNSQNLKLSTSLEIKENKFQKLKSELDDLKFQYKELQKLHNELLKEYNTFKSKNNQQNSFKQMHKKMELLSAKNRELRLYAGKRESTIETLIKDLDSLRINKIDGYSDLFKQKIEQLENDKYSLIVENQNLRKRLRQYETIEEKQSNDIESDNYNGLKIKSQEPKNVLVEIKEFMGMLRNINGKWSFENFDGDIFENINVKRYYLDDLEEIFCIAEYDKNNEVYNIINIYPYISDKNEFISHLYEMDLRKKKTLKISKPNEVKKEYLNYENFNNQKVLVINSFNQNYYISELRKYNLKVHGFDTYLENPQKIIPKLNKFDVVICCTGTSRHYINNIIENTNDYYDDGQGNRNEKYQFMERVTMTNLLNRINYAIENLK